jgi:hypothetical protein
MELGSHQVDSSDAGISTKPSLSFWEMMPAQLGRGDWYSRVQPFVGRLLAKYLEDQHKSFDPHGSELQWRRLAPEGIDDLQGPTLIEILPTATLILEKLHQNRMLNELRASRSNSLLIVSLSELSSKEQNSIRKGLKEPLGGIPVIIWEKDKVVELLLKYAEFVGDEVPGLRGVAVDNIVEKSLESKPDDWKQTRDQHVAQLKKEYRENGLVLILGAGVSLSTMRIPSWNNLLSRLFVAMIDSKFPADLSVRPEEMEYLVETLHSVHNAFPLIEAHYIRAGLEESFGEAVAKHSTLISCLKVRLLLHC